MWRGNGIISDVKNQTDFWWYIMEHWRGIPLVQLPMKPCCKPENAAAPSLNKMVPASETTINFPKCQPFCWLKWLFHCFPSFPMRKDNKQLSRSWVSLRSPWDLNLFNDNKQFLSIGIVGETHRPKICSVFEKTSVILVDNIQFHNFGHFYLFQKKRQLERLGMELCNWLAANTWYNPSLYLRCLPWLLFFFCCPSFELYSSRHLKRSNIIPKMNPRLPAPR